MTEGASSNAWIVAPDGALVYPFRSTGTILAGVTRATVDRRRCRARLDRGPSGRSRRNKLTTRARLSFPAATPHRAARGRRLMGVPIGGGQPGPVATTLRRRFHDIATRG